MREEMRLFFSSFVEGRRDLRELLVSDTTFVNHRLATHYDIVYEELDPETWIEVETAGTQRGGILTNAGLMMVLSTPLRTSVVRRGKWVLGQLLCAEPAPPPAGVEGLPEDEDEEPEVGLTLRERLERHRADPTCASCHRDMDAIGFGLESYDGIGAFRTIDNGDRIDASGELFGTPFDGALELSTIIAADDRYAECVVEKLFTYAVGRGPTDGDRPYLVELTDGFVEAGYLFEELAVLIATSEPFTTRRGSREDDQ